MTNRPLLAAVLLAACVVSPLEHSNYFDPATKARLTMTADDDSIEVAGGIVTLTVTSEPDFPPERPGAITQIVSGSAIQLDYSRFMINVTGLVWQPVRLRAFVHSELPPSAEITVWARQVPVDINLQCAVSCTLSDSAPIATIVFSLRDAGLSIIPLPPTDYRFGTVDVLTPGIVNLIGRPTPTTMTVVSVTPGSTWIRLSGEGIADSILVTVP